MINMNNPRNLRKLKISHKLQIKKGLPVCSNPNRNRSLFSRNSMNHTMSIMAKPLYDRKESSIGSVNSIFMEKGNYQVEFEVATTNNSPIALDQTS